MVAIESSLPAGRSGAARQSRAAAPSPAPPGLRLSSLLCTTARCTCSPGVRLIPGVPCSVSGCPRAPPSPGVAGGDLAAWCTLCPPPPQSSKVLAKRELLYVPLIGWTWYFLEIVFCKRRWEEDRDTVVRGLQRLADYPEHMWVSPCARTRRRCPSHG